MRVERDTGRRGNAGVVISTLLSLAVVGVAVAVVAWLVLRTPSSAVDSAERLDPVGTAIAAPTEQPSLPTPIPTAVTEPEPTALGFTGEAPPANALPTAPPAVAETLPETSGPTPTPRVVALPTAIPAAMPTVPPAATLPPAQSLPPAPVEQVPVVALAPVESAPPPAPTANPNAGQPTPEATSEVDDDPFDIFGEDENPRIVPAQNDALERVREIQDENRDRAADDTGAPVAVATIEIPIIQGRDDAGSIEVVIPDTEAMIEEITARATDPNRNPNVNGIVPSANSDNTNDNRPAASRDDGRREPGSSLGSKRKESSRDRNRRTPTPTVEPDDEKDRNGRNTNSRGNDRNQEECENPFSSLPEDQRPDNYEFFNKC